MTRLLFPEWEIIESVREIGEELVDHEYNRIDGGKFLLMKTFWYEDLQYYELDVLVPSGDVLYQFNFGACFVNSDGLANIEVEYMNESCEDFIRSLYE